jgi:hypothetical protein
MVICPVVKAYRDDNEVWYSWGDNHISNVVNNFNKNNVYSLPFYWIGMKNYRFIYNMVRAEPNSGIMALGILLQYNIKKLFVTGFSFYQQNTKMMQDVYFDTYSTEKFKNDYKNIDMSQTHQQLPQILFFINMLKKHSNIIFIDSFLCTLLNLKYENVCQL